MDNGKIVKINDKVSKAFTEVFVDITNNATKIPKNIFLLILFML